MLSRTASNLFWIARYMERADYVVRLLEVAQRMAALAPSGAPAGNEWHSAIIAAGCEEGFFERHDTVTPSAAMAYLIRDPANPSSLVNCIQTARTNARAVRGGLTRDAWEAINSTWLEADRRLRSEDGPESLGGVLDWVRERALLFLGAYGSTMLRNDAYHFLRLGTFLERADNTARILDVKYHVLLPTFSGVGGGLDYHQWTAILRAVSAGRAYHWVFNDRVKPWKVAELLILRPEMPRSLRAAFDHLVESLDALAESHGGNYGEAHRLAGELHARLKFGKTEQIYQGGLHEFLTDYIDTGLVLGDEIAKFYLF